MSINVCNDRSMASITSLPSGVSGSSLVLLSTQTASSSATIDFTSNIDSTYDSYVFKFINIHPATDNAEFLVNFRDGGSSFDATKTTTYIKTRHGEDGSLGSIVYDDGNDLAQSTSSQRLIENAGGDNDQGLSGTLQLFNPSSTTFVKHFITDINSTSGDNASDHILVAGYCNVTAAIDGVQFSFSTGNIDAGTIKMYGVV